MEKDNKSETNKINFDMSNLTLKELIDTYNNITDLLTSLNDKKIVLNEKEEKNE